MTRICPECEQPASDRYPSGLCRDCHEKAVCQETRELLVAATRIDDHREGRRKSRD